jgi:hypothetical protein
MKKFSICFLLLFCSISFFGQLENELYRELIKTNRISEKHTYEYDLKTGDSILKNITIFDLKGYILKYLIYNEKGEQEFKYLTEKTEDSLIRAVGAYDQNGQLRSTTIRNYDEKGNQISYKQVTPTGDILNPQQRTYNDIGQNIELYNKDRNSNRFFKSTEYYYREDGQYQKEISFNAQGKITAINEYEYDENGNRTALYQIVDKIKELVSTSEYNDKNQKIKQHRRTINFITRDGRVNFGDGVKTTIFSYDKEGNLIEEAEYEKKELKKLTKYFYKKITK